VVAMYSQIMQGDYGATAMPRYENASIYSVVIEPRWFSVRLASRVTPKVFMLSEKGIWEPR